MARLLYLLATLHMRSTRATAAVARLNARSDGHHYHLVLTGDGLFKLSEPSGNTSFSNALPLDEFVRMVDAMGPQKIRRVTKSDAAFALQLVRKPKT